MSEEKPSYLHPKGELRFVRLKNTFEDLVGYVSTNEGYLTIYQPLRIEIDTLFDEGRQILSLQEYLPQSVIDIKEIKILLTEIMFISPVKWEFYEQYEYVADFFYNNTAKLKTTEKKKTSSSKEDITETAQKVVSILEAMANKKDKPVH